MKKFFSYLCIISIVILSFQSAYAVKKDNAAPIVIQTEPGNGAANVQTNKNIVIKFNEKIVKGNTFLRIKLADSPKKPVNITASIEKNSLVIKHINDLDFETEYVLTIPANAVKDASGNGLKKAFVLKFTTQSDTSEGIVRVFQDGKEVKADSSDNLVHLERDTFSLRFKMPIESTVQVAALDNQFDYDFAEKGMHLEDILYFTPGTGIATDGSYPSMYLNNEGHHYMFYSDDNDSRLTLISEDEDSIIDADWQINSLLIYDSESYEYSEYSFWDFPLDNIYIIVINDIDSDNIIDEGEYSKLVVTFN
ncbi:MAG: hypothetical protein K0R50_3508 [Eubacterium sp.]|jgi:methionine-rich copper-binding protein CopC|nr:hypothetical protein [Eubacterium sp.]